MAAAGPGATAGAQLFCLNVCLRVKAERREEFLTCIRNNQRCTLSSEPLVESYVFGEDESTPNTWHFFEKYRGRAGFEHHCGTPHFAAWEAFAASDPFTAPPRVEFYTLDTGTS
jgi:quinol monooxygenase YgiN